jgi:hypothetical protein
VNEAVADVGIFIRRILRPKTPTADESKEKPSPQRPPPPSRHQTPTPNEKSSITIGKVGLQFDCQVIDFINCIQQRKLIHPILDIDQVS